VKHPRPSHADRRLEALLERTRETVRAPRGFSYRVMDVVYKESLVGRSQPAEAAAPRAGPGLLVSRLYRRLGWSFMVTAAVLAVSLLIPHGAYPTLVRSGGAEAIVQNALVSAGEAVQGALGEKQIGWSNP
jgi:hypothetical protein